MKFLNFVQTLTTLSNSDHLRREPESGRARLHPEGALEAAGAVLAQQDAHAVLYLVDVVRGDAVPRGDGLRALAAHPADVYREVATGHVLFIAEHLEGADEDSILDEILKETKLPDVMRKAAPKQDQVPETAAQKAAQAISK